MTQRHRKIQVICPGCGKDRGVRESSIKYAKQAGTYTGLCNPCVMATRKGENHPSWKGGRYVDDKGYVRVLTPDHPRADAHGYVREHRLVMEKHIGRYLTQEETVHHENGNRQDNRLDNLEHWQKAHPRGIRASLDAPYIVKEDSVWEEMW